LGLTQGAVAMRLQRGKLALRRVLTSDLAAEATPFGIVAGDGWQATPIWCTVCARGRLDGRLDLGRRWLRLRCSSESCPAHRSFGNGWFPEGIAGVAPYRRALTALLDRASAYYRQAVPAGVSPCLDCGDPMPLRVGEPPWGSPVPWRETTFHGQCARCGSRHDFRLSGMALALPESKRFWRAHPRMRLLPEQQTRLGERPALRSAFESDEGARLEVLFDPSSFGVLAIRGGPTT
jgi:hypothetical protein